MCNVSVLHARNVFKQITVWIEINKKKNEITQSVYNEILNT